MFVLISSALLRGHVLPARGQLRPPRLQDAAALHRGAVGRQERRLPRGRRPLHQGHRRRRQGRGEEMHDTTHSLEDEYLSFTNMPALECVHKMCLYIQGSPVINLNRACPKIEPLWAIWGISTINFTTYVMAE